MLLVQEFLETHTFSELKEKHGVEVSFNKKGTLFSLNYNQIESKNDDPLAQDCRGLILSLNDKSSLLAQTKLINNRYSYDHICPGHTNIVAWPFKRFFNYGQQEAANVDMNDASIIQKVDGTLIICYYFEGKFNIATRSVPEADIVLDPNNSLTFRTLFEKVLKETYNVDFDTFSKELSPDYTYMFELCSYMNRIVVRYETDQIFFLSVRNKFTGREEVPHQKLFGISQPKEFSLSSINDIVSFVNETDAFQQEGVVVRDSNFNRIKIKNPQHNLMNKARDLLGSSQRACLSLILLEKDDDAMPLLNDQIKKNILSLKESFVKLNHYVNDQFDKCYADTQKDIELNKQENARKLFALNVQRYNCFSAYMFDRFVGKTADFKSWVLSKQKNNEWPNGFLDSILENLK